MILQIDDWVFDVDLEKTKAYSTAEAAEHCTCAYCRNFYAALDSRYPQLRPFLAQFGLDVEAPDRMSPMDHSAEGIDYDPSYYVFGRILQPGQYEMTAGLVNVVATSLDDRDCFCLDVYDVMLPWVLDEPFEGGIPQKPTINKWFRKLLQ